MKVVNWVIAFGNEQKWLDEMKTLEVQFTYVYNLLFLKLKKKTCHKTIVTSLYISCLIFTGNIHPHERNILIQVFEILTRNFIF